MASCRPLPPGAAATREAAATTATARAAATPGAAAIYVAATPFYRAKITPVQAVMFWRRLPTLRHQQSLSPVRHRHT